MNKELIVREVLEQFQAEFENACDYLYYGLGKKRWLQSCNGSMTEEEAAIVWKAAFDKMANE